MLTLKYIQTIAGELTYQHKLMDSITRTDSEPNS